MLKIGKIYRKQMGDQSRLCADISLNGRSTTLWFGVDVQHEIYLCEERSDAFVMALLPAAMRSGYEIVCQTPMSERLHYQLSNYLIPTLCDAGDLYHPVKITAPLTAERIVNQGGIGTGFSGGVDCLYTIMTHGKTSVYPLTHLAVFNVGVFEGPAYREAFRKSCRNALPFAEEMGLELVCLDSNISKVLPERFLDVYSFRNLAGAMALQGLFSRYLLSSGHDMANFVIDFRNSATYDPLTVHCAQTENLSISLSGCQVQRNQKLAALSNWPMAFNWLHPCFCGHVGEKNCGHCKKCILDMTTLYALGTLEKFEAVFDIAAFKAALPLRIGFVLANEGNHWYDETLNLLRQAENKIPPSAYIFAKQFRKALEKQEEKI